MTREEAIDILQNTSFFGRSMDDIDAAIDIAVKALSNSENSNRWIPVSEKLPPQDMLVILSIEDDSGDYIHKYTDCGWMYNGLWVVDNNRIPTGYVKAWMPLPEVYKNEREVIK